MEVVINSEAELPLLAEKILEKYKDSRVFIFEGDLGAGKTTLIKVLAQKLGVSSGLSSPSFGIINEYVSSNGNPIYHMDCYRLKDVSEAYDIGLEEILYDGHYCFIEWPDKIYNLLPDNFVWVRIRVSDKQRTFNTGYHDQV